MNAVRTCWTAPGALWMAVAIVTSAVEAAPVLITPDDYKAPVPPIVEDIRRRPGNAPGLIPSAP
jgi:hypothetical protein